MGKNIKITGKVGFIIGILIISLFPVKLLSQYPNWTVYDTTNSGLPSNVVWAIAIDGSGNKWIGTRGGLAEFDGTNWTVYNTSNSGLPDNWVEAIAIDDMGNKWMEQVVEDLQSLMEPTGLCITLRIQVCLLMMFVQ